MELSGLLTFCMLSSRGSDCEARADYSGCCVEIDPPEHITWDLGERHRRSYGAERRVYRPHGVLDIVLSASVIICSHNGTSRLPFLIRSLMELRISRDTEIEVVFVDSASRDGTLDFVRSFELPFPLKFCRLSEPGQSRALNRAIELSVGELLLFTDDDCRLDVDWLSAYLDAATEVSAAGYFFGRVVPRLPSSLPYWWKLAPRSLRGRDQGQDLVIYDSFCRESYPIGCNMAVRRSAFSNGLRFEEKLGPDPESPTWLGADTKLGGDLQQMGFAGCYVPHALVYHNVRSGRISWRYLVAHFWVSGRCSVYYKPSGSGVCRLHFASGHLLTFISSTFALAFQIACGRRLAARRTQLSMIKTAGVVWEYTTTLGGRLR